MLFNPEGHPIHTIARNLLADFERSLQVFVQEVRERRANGLVSQEMSVSVAEEETDVLASCWLVSTTATATTTTMPATTSISLLQQESLPLEEPMPVERIDTCQRHLLHIDQEPVTRASNSNSNSNTSHSNYWHASSSSESISELQETADEHRQKRSRTDD